LKIYQTGEKYKGLAAYEWQVTETRDQRAYERKKKLVEAERTKKAHERKAHQAVERVERDKFKEDRRETRKLQME
jgi:hypothetical protein